MSDTPIAVLVQFSARPGKEPDVESAMREAFGWIREEAGCRTLVGHRSSEDPRRFMIYEEWSSEDRFRGFLLGSERLNRYLTELDGMVEGRTVTTWQPAA